ncbi:MAG: hypothetical protein IKQ55_05735 [Kiritimatiellae bacterium]|nr:hypothetical protein [Kiritimatiellia bacterium]
MDIANGFAAIGAGLWLLAPSQPAAFEGAMTRRRRTGWRVPDRAALDLVELDGPARCATAERPFLTHIPCAAPIHAVSAKVLVAPASARRGAEVVRPVPLSAKGSFCVTQFDHPGETSNDSTIQRSNDPTIQRPNAWVVMATAARTARVQVSEGGTLSVRPGCVVAWTGPRPTGYCPRLRLRDLILPRPPRDLLLHFHGPCLVWIEGTPAPVLPAPRFPWQRRAA